LFDWGLFWTAFLATLAATWPIDVSSLAFIIMVRREIRKSKLNMILPPIREEDIPAIRWMIENQLEIARYQYAKAMSGKGIYAGKR